MATVGASTELIILSAIYHVVDAEPSSQLMTGPWRASSAIVAVLDIQDPFARIHAGRAY